MTTASVVVVVDRLRPYRGRELELIVTLRKKGRLGALVLDDKFASDFSFLAVVAAVADTQTTGPSTPG